MKKFSLLLLSALLSMVFFKPPVSAQSVVKSKAYYDAITYTWTDDGGNTVTSKLTDKATDPYQIIALLEKVYGDPQIPGPSYSAYGDIDSYGNYDNTVRTDPVNYSSIDDGIWEVTSSKPTEEGYTVLLVAVKDDFTPGSTPTYMKTFRVGGGLFGTTYDGLDTRENLVKYIDKSIDYVQLLTDGMRMGKGDNAGTVYTVEGKINRFFFLSKGQARKMPNTNYIEAPFGTMFEQFSPTDGLTGSSAQVLTDFYDKMTKGESYPIQHDCNSVLETQHYFSMSGPEGTEAYDMTGLNFFIPDHRLDCWQKSYGYDGRDMNSSGDNLYAKYGMYNTAHQPSTFLYTIKLHAAAEQEGADSVHKYKVSLSWTSSLKNHVSEDVQEQFDVYRVVDGVVETTPIATGLTDTTYSYTVDQKVSGYAISYVVKGRPVGATYKPIQSNIATVQIPGYDPLERLKLAIVGDYKSTYDATQEVNQYENTIVISNGVGTSVKREHLTSNPALQVVRTYQDASGSSVSVPVASIQLSNVTSKSSSCSYVMTYANQSTTKSNVSGTLRFNTDGELNFNNLTITDDFNADVSKNEHPGKYTYQVRFTSAVAVLDEKGEAKTEIYSNTVEVPVYKTNTALLDCYDKATVDADFYRPDQESVVIPEKDANPMGLRFNVVDNPNIFRYFTTRDGYEYGHAQRMTDGSYVVSSVRPGESVKSHVETVTFATDENSKYVGVRDYAINGLDYHAGDMVTYNAVIEAFLPNSTSTDHNTYGSCRQVSKIVDLQAKCVDRMKSNDIFTDAGTEGRYYLSQLEITPVIPDGFKLYKLRVWRKTADGVAMEVKDEYKWRLNQVTKPLEIDFDDSGEIVSFNFNTLKGQEPKWDGISSIIVNDYFGAVNQELSTTYYVRAYLRYHDGTTLNGRKRAAADVYHYLADQASLEVKFDNHVVTGIDGVSSARKVQRVTYVNALGMHSDVPFSGVNVVVTTYSDGSVTKVKKIIK